MNETIGTLAELVGEQTIADLQSAIKNDEQAAIATLPEPAEIKDAQVTVHENLNRGTIRKAKDGFHVGPLAPKHIRDIVSASSVERDRLIEQPFVDGVLAMVEADLANDISLTTLGAYYTYVEALAESKRNDETDEQFSQRNDIFESVLCSLCQSPLPAEYEEASKDSKTGEISSIKVFPTARQRLAHAIYFERFPDLWNTFTSGNMRLATKRVENAIGKYTKVQKAQTEIARSTMANMYNAILPDLELTDAAKAEVAKAAADKAAEKATKSTLPNSPGKVFAGLYKIRFATPELTKAHRDQVQRDFISLGFPLDKIREWHANFMKDGNAKLELEHFQKLGLLPAAETAAN